MVCPDVFSICRPCPRWACVSVHTAPLSVWIACVPDLRVLKHTCVTPSLGLCLQESCALPAPLTPPLPTPSHPGAGVRWLLAGQTLLSPPNILLLILRNHRKGPQRHRICCILHRPGAPLSLLPISHWKEKLTSRIAAISAGFNCFWASLRFTSMKL